MSRVLVIDDQLSDLKIAVRAVHSVGVEDVKAVTTVSSAMNLLESALSGGVPMPDAIILDLDLGYGSGHELLRFWHRHLKSAGVAMIVWTALGEAQGDICKLFGVQAVISKWQGDNPLRAALTDCCRVTR